MSAAVTNPPTRTDSKTAKKRKSKAVPSRTTSSAASTTPTAEVNSTAPATTNTTEGTNGSDTKDFESPYIKELYKSIRNVNKKINATAKVDAIIAENSDKSLDELVAERKINNDQKASALKKPALLASLSQLEEQVAQYKKFDEDYQARLNNERDSLRKSHDEDVANAVAKAKEESRADALKEERRHTLLLSRFLRLAAAKRQESDGQPDTAEKRALEGLLLLVYGGDDGAVQAVEKLIRGVEEPVLNMMQEPEEFTYAQVKQASINYEPYDSSLEDHETGDSQTLPSTFAGEDKNPVVDGDPTIAHAGLTELDMPSLSNGKVDPVKSPVGIQQGTVDAGAANEVAESHSDVRMSASVEGPDGWVEVTNKATGTDNTGASASTPPPTTGTQSWADDNVVTTPPAIDTSARMTAFTKSIIIRVEAVAVVDRMESIEEVIVEGAVSVEERAIVDVGDTVGIEEKAVIEVVAAEALGAIVVETEISSSNENLKMLEDRLQPMLE
ncbi:MAG: hypothetical protein M1833_006593 [Piccolia ochrophora]|nr:MAG: hypothetical protein M1833_006593 [Piccolia ochrophora]